MCVCVCVCVCVRVCAYMYVNVYVCNFLYNLSCIPNCSLENMFISIDLRMTHFDQKCVYEVCQSVENWSSALSTFGGNDDGFNVVHQQALYRKICFLRSVSSPYTDH